MDSNPARFATPLRRFGIAAALVTLFAGAVVEVGWLLDVPGFKSVVPSLVPMHPATAVLFMLLATSMLLALSRSSSPALYITHKLLAATVFALGVLSLIGHLFDLRIGPGPLLERSMAVTGILPTRPAIGTAISFMLLGLALLLRGFRPLRLVASAAAVLALMISVVALYGYILSVPSLYSMLFHNRAMALNTTVLFLLMSLATLFNNPYGWVVRTVFREGTGGRLARWLLPFALFGPGLLSLLFELGVQQELYRSAFGEALQALTTALSFSLLILVFAWRTSTLDALKRRKEELEKSHAELRDVADDLARVNLHLERLSGTDPLTGLYNRRVFNLRLEEELARSHRYALPLSVLMLDVDNFKSYNDTFGHPAGDEVLKTIAHLLAQSVREIDCVARLGGEEFGVVLPETGKARALASAERIRRAIEAARWPQRRVTVSVGVAALSRAWHGAEALTRAADAALYEAKRGGRNRVAGARPHVARRAAG